MCFRLNNVSRWRNSERQQLAVFISVRVIIDECVAAVKLSWFA